VDNRLQTETFTDPVPGMSPGDQIDYSLAFRSRGAITVTMIDDWGNRVLQQRMPGRWDTSSMHETWKWAWGLGVKSSSIVDGTSKTVVVSEVWTVDGSAGSNARFSEDIRGVWACSSLGMLVDGRQHL
jgi:hypothetical protein